MKINTVKPLVKYYCSLAAEKNPRIMLFLYKELANLNLKYCSKYWPPPPPHSILRINKNDSMFHHIVHFVLLTQMKLPQFSEGLAE